MKETTLLYAQVLNDINIPANEESITIIRELIEPHGESIARHFYTILLENKQAAGFLNHDAVKTRLMGSMINWINDVFVYRPKQLDIDSFLQAQAKVGQVHARIDLPVYLVNYGMYLIKNDVMHHLMESKLDRKQLVESMVIANNLLDCSLAAINESYKNDLVINENQNQSFRLHASSNNLALECERLRTSLSEWMRDLMFSVQLQQIDNNSIANIRHSGFGLWVTHKAHLYLHNRDELQSLNQLLDDIDENINELTEQKGSAQIESSLKNLNTLVSNSIWLLGSLAKEIIEENNGKDTLTNLLNRFYLDTVLRQETDFSLHKGLVYGLVYLDIDHFKQVNDNYGHANGDTVLVKIAGVLINTVRTGDFVFRLGGEEFLVVLGDCNQHILNNVAEKIRRGVEKFDFTLDNGQVLNITVSLGTALHDGHPDYSHTMKLADTALYKAKENGRNQVVSAG